MKCAYCGQEIPEGVIITKTADIHKRIVHAEGTVIGELVVYDSKWIFVPYHNIKLDRITLASISCAIENIMKE